jgi:hypothetical protein
MILKPHNVPIQPAIENTLSHPGHPGQPIAATPWWLAGSAVEIAAPVVDEPLPVPVLVPLVEPLPPPPIIAVDGRACPKCAGPLVETRTFDGYLNIECQTCDRCVGCRAAKDYTQLGVAE